MELSGFVAKEESFCGAENDVNNAKNLEFDIAFGVDKNYLPPLGILLNSLCMNNPNLKFAFHIFSDDVLPSDKEKLKKLLDIYPQHKINIYYINTENLKITGRILEPKDIATYYRIIIPELVPKEVHRVLYMDADMLCLESIEEIPKMDFDGAILIAVLDKVINARTYHKRDIGIKEDDPYFNAGLIYINADLWRKEDISQKAYDILQERDLLLRDQDALNIAVNGKWQELPVKFNTFVTEEVHSKPKDVAILHYVAGCKPWVPWDVNSLKSRLYDEYRDKSPWSDFTYDPRNTRQMRLLAKTTWIRGKKADAAKLYIKYLLSKAKGKK